MNPNIVQHRAEQALYRQTVAYYSSTRRPWLERITFTFALLSSILVSLRRLGLGFTDYENHGQWLTLFYWVSLLLFLGLDTVFAKAHHQIQIPFGGLNPSRIFEKFVMQGRVWQLLLVLMLPVSARLLDAFLYFNSVR